MIIYLSKITVKLGYDKLGYDSALFAQRNFYFYHYFNFSVEVIYCIFLILLRSFVCFFVCYFCVSVPIQ